MLSAIGPHPVVILTVHKLLLACLQNASMVQMLPFGWNLTQPGGEEWVIRGGLYRQMGAIQSVRNSYWVNSNPKHAFFQK